MRTTWLPITVAALLFAPASRAQYFGPPYPVTQNQFFLEKDVVFDGRLLGRWQDVTKNDASGCCEIQKRDARSYALKEPADTNQLIVLHLFKLRGRWLMNVFSEAGAFNGHAVFRVDQFEPTLRFSILSIDRIDELLREKPFVFRQRFRLRKGPARKTAEDLVAASTKELRAFLLEHLRDPKLFEMLPGKGEIRRVSEPPGNAAPPRKSI